MWAISQVTKKLKCCEYGPLALVTFGDCVCLLRHPFSGNSTLRIFFQFTVVFIKSMVVIFGIAECGYPWQFSVVTATLMLLFFFLFAEVSMLLNFYPASEIS